MLKGYGALCLFFMALPVWAQSSVSVGGIMGNRALISVDGAPPKVVGVGQSHNGVRVLSVQSDSVSVEVGGRRVSLSVGQGYYAGSQGTGSSGSGEESRDGKVVLTADGRGQFTAQGSVNGASVSFMVDTGASLVTIPTSLARRAGVRVENGTPVSISTANGRASAYKVTFGNVRIGGISLNMVDGLVVDDRGLGVPLLGMSFLNRTNMVREGDTLVLTQRY